MKCSSTHLGSLVSALAMTMLTVPVALAADAPAKAASPPCVDGNPCAAKKRASKTDNPCAAKKRTGNTDNPCAAKLKCVSKDDTNSPAGTSRKRSPDNPCAGKTR